MSECYSVSFDKGLKLFRSQNLNLKFIQKIDLQQVTLQTTASPSAASHADLIRQLNLARAQGLVVLQQWGDKQVP